MIDPLASKLRLLTIALNGMGTLLILILVAIINLDVVSMNTLGAPIAGVKESVALSIVVIVFLQMPETLRAGRHIASDMWISRLCDRHTRAGSIVQLFYNLLGAVIILTIARFGIPMTTEAYTQGYFVGTLGVFTLPTWPTFAIVVFCSLVTALTYFVIALQHARDALRGQSGPASRKER